MSVFSFVFLLSSCTDNHVTDNQGVVTEVKAAEGLSHTHDKTYVVQVEIKKDELTYYLYTDEEFNVGDIIAFKQK